MELRLNRERVEYLQRAVDRTTEDTFTADVVIPDVLPDAAAIALTEGDFCLWRLDFSSGSAEAEGEWKGTVCYLADQEDGLVSFPVSVGVRLRVFDDAIEAGIKPFASFRVTELSGQMMNSRKIRVLVRVMISLEGYLPEYFSMACLPEERQTDVFFRQERVPCTIVTDVREQVFTAADRVALKNQPSGGLLASHSELVYEQPSVIGGRSVLQGKIRTELLYAVEGSQLPISQTVEMPFSQLLDLDPSIEAAQIDLRLQLTAAELTIQESSLEAEFHIVMQMVCARLTELPVLVDAYSVRDLMNLQSEPLQVSAWNEKKEITQNITCAVSDVSPDAQIISCMARIRSIRVRNAVASGKADMIILTSGENGMLHSYLTDAPFSVEIEPDMHMLHASVGSVSVQSNTGGLQVTVPLTIVVRSITETTVNQVVTMERGDPDAQLLSAPSIMLIPNEEALDLWCVAKRYASSTDAILAANPKKDGEPVPSFWIIPRIRADS